MPGWANRDGGGDDDSGGEGSGTEAIDGIGEDGSSGEGGGSREDGGSGEDGGSREDGEDDRSRGCNDSGGCEDGMVDDPGSNEDCPSKVVSDGRAHGGGRDKRGNGWLSLDEGANDDGEGNDVGVCNIPTIAGSDDAIASNTGIETPSLSISMKDVAVEASEEDIINMTSSAEEVENRDSPLCIVPEYNIISSGVSGALRSKDGCMREKGGVADGQVSGAATSGRESGCVGTVDDSSVRSELTWVSDIGSTGGWD